jgi:hypothetical protein
MTVNDAISKLNAKVCNLEDGEREVKAGYAGDFLSNVMGKAPTDCVWFTVMNNVNVAAVATLADVAVIVLCEGTMPDDKLSEKCGAQGINLVSVKEDVYTAVLKLNA